jgi:hypothetical protein
MVKRTGKVMESHSLTLIRTANLSDPNQLEVHTRCQWRRSYYGSRVVTPLSALECIDTETPDIDEHVKDALTKLLYLPGIEHILVFRYSIRVQKGGSYNWHKFAEKDPPMQSLILDIVRELENKYN